MAEQTHAAPDPAFKPHMSAVVASKEHRWRYEIFNRGTSDEELSIFWRSVYMPCVLFGRNSNAAFGKHERSNMLLYLLLGIVPLLATFLIALFILRTRPGAAVAIQCAGLLTWALLVYMATGRRRKMQRDFNIVDSSPGSFLRDCMYWYFCCCFMLAQETRTLVHNQVEDGDWRGPAQEDVEAAAAPQEQVMIKQ